MANESSRKNKVAAEIQRLVSELLRGEDEAGRTATDDEDVHVAGKIFQRAHCTRGG